MLRASHRTSTSALLSGVALVAFMACGIDPATSPDDRACPTANADGSADHVGYMGGTCH